MILKDGVRLEIIAPAGYRILTILRKCEIELGIKLRITSGTDGIHSGPTDPHYQGKAYDIGSKEFDPIQKKMIMNWIQSRLGPELFHIILENLGQPNEHFHVQRNLGTEYTYKDLIRDL